ncbi:MAG TPA: hypothetical protein VF757_09110 [Sphingomicrobium sp.]
MLSPRHLRRVSAIALGAAALIPAQADARTVSIPFSAANFPATPSITNTYFPLVPGTTYTFKADTKDGCEVDLFVVTHDTRVIDGVTTEVIHDSIFDGDTCTTDPSALTEDTFDHFAQDNSGNVWYFGEDTFDCEGANSCVPGEGGWIAGVNGAVPGIAFLANPRSGDTYRQEFSPGVAEDQATVTATGVTAKLRRDDALQNSFSNCIVTKEFTVLEKGSIGSKTYCPGVGVVLDIDHHGPILRSELVSISNSANALKFRTLPKH